MQKRLGLILRVTILSLLVACADDNKAKAPGQVAAIVNDEEITIYQLEDALHQAGLVRDKQGKQAMPQLLGHLIDQSLILQQAKADKLERDAGVMMALEAAKRKILTEEWLQRKMNSVKKANSQEIEAFYNAHPELFEKRKIFQLKELFIDSKSGSQSKIDKIIDSTDDVNTLEHHLEAQNVPFNVNQSTLTAEQLPMDRLLLLSALPHGHFIKVISENGVLIEGILSTKESPTDKTKAASLIEAFLNNQERKKESEALIKYLHETAKIEYLGEFAKLNQTDKQVNQENESVPSKQP